jgi:glycosyltransferase involved in cell wall biosynthesis
VSIVRVWNETGEELPLIAGHDILFVLPTAWDHHWGPHQQIASRLAEANRVLVLELPVSPLSPFAGSHGGTCLRQVRRYLAGGRQSDNPNLKIASPPPVFPFRYHKTTNYLSQKILLRYLKSEAERLGFDNPLLITFQTDSGRLVRALKARAKIYYCADDWSALGRWWQPADKVKQREAELVKACDLVFATSRRLASMMGKLGTPSYFNPNAADFELFSQAQFAEPPEEISSLRHPVIGFAGMMSTHSFDEDLMLWLAERHPEWTFVIVGKKLARDPDLSRLEQLHNVRFAGFQPLEMLPKYLAGMDVCLIPRRQTEWVKSAFSLKLFEYLGAGKPVVATRTEEFLPYEEMVYLPNNHTEFERCIVEALREDSPELVRRRMELARENTWDGHVERFSKTVQAFLDRAQSRLHGLPAVKRSTLGQLANSIPSPTDEVPKFAGRPFGETP